MLSPTSHSSGGSGRREEGISSRSARPRAADSELLAHRELFMKRYDRLTHNYDTAGKLARWGCGAAGPREPSFLRLVRAALPPEPGAKANASGRAKPSKPPNCVTPTIICQRRGRPMNEGSFEGVGGLKIFSRSWHPAERCSQHRPWRRWCAPTSG